MVTIRGIDFRPVENASGARNFFGEGWWYSPILKKFFGVDWSQCGFVAKTTTVDPRPGNMPLVAGSTQPLERRPKCIKMYFRKGVALNAVGLSGPGLRKLLEDGRWQNMTEPFWISFMAVGETLTDRLEEAAKFARILRLYQKGFKAPFGLERNYSCPNVGLNYDVIALKEEICGSSEIFESLDVPQRIKLDVTVPVDIVHFLQSHNGCDAVTMSNTVKFGKLPDEIPWKALFGTDDPAKSPLAKYGGGGLSGWPLHDLVCSWINKAVCKNRFTKPIFACGGMGSLEAVRHASLCYARGIQIGVDAVLRPHRFRPAVEEAYNRFLH